MDISKIVYRVAVIAPDGTQLDITGLLHGLGWAEGAKELSAKINLKVAVCEDITDKIAPLTPVIVYADSGAGFEEVIRGNVQKYELCEANNEYFIELETADECHALRHNQDDLFFTDGHTSSALLNKIFDKWEVPHEIQIVDSSHSKKVYRKKYLSDMIADVLKDLKEKGGGTYFVRAKEGVVQIIPRGTNQTVLHFDSADNLVKVRESYDASKVVTRVQVVGKQDSEGKQRIEATVDGKTELGIRQVIYPRGDKQSAGEAETAAKKILEENDIKRTFRLEAPDVPFLRKGDKVRVRASSGEEFFFVKSIRHNAFAQKMTLELDSQNDSLAKTDESDSEAPP